MNPTHANLLKEIAAIHAKKAADYATESDPYSNFSFAASLAEKFTDPVDKVFATLIGVKIARIAELTQPGRKVNNESLDDSYVDLTNYSAIWTSYRRDRKKVGSEPIGPPTHPYPEAAFDEPHRFYNNGHGICSICGLRLENCLGKPSNALA